MSDQNNITDIIKIQVTEKNTKVVLFIKEPDPEKPFEITNQNIYDALYQAGVEYGINKEIIENIIVEKKWGEKFVVAEGVLPVPGESAKIEFKFPTEKTLKPQVKEDGKIDYKEASVLKSVEKDEILAEKIGAKLGEKGIDVFGNEIPAVYGKDIEMPIAGPGTYKDPGNSSLIKSSIEGVVYYNPRNRTIEVQKLYIVPGSVDYSTGNINVKSSIEIRGDVKPGFSVTSPYNIQIKGVAEHAIIVCEGTLKVTNGIIGDGKQTIKVGGDIHAGYINNQNINCGGSIYVANEIRHSIIECDSEVIITKTDGVIVGGKITAPSKITAPIIGNQYNITTELEVGLREKYREEYVRRHKELKILKGKIDEQQDLINSMMKKAALMDSPHSTRLNSLLEQSDKLISSYEKLKSETQEFEDNFFSVKNPTIIVTKIVYPGTIIRIKYAMFEVKEELYNVTFRLIDGEVVPTKIQ